MAVPNFSSADDAKSDDDPFGISQGPPPQSPIQRAREARRLEELQDQGYMPHEVSQGQGAGNMLGLGVLLLILGVGMFFWFAHAEVDGGQVRGHILAIIIYSIFGKWGVLFIIGGLGAILSLVGITQLANQSQSASQPDTHQDINA